MCIELLNYQEQHGKDFSNFFNLKEIIADVTPGMALILVSITCAQCEHVTSPKA